MKLALALVIALAADARAECVSYGIIETAAQPPAALPADGGIVIHAEAKVGNPNNGTKPAWKWKGGGAATYKAIAPGLGVYAPSKEGTHELVDGRGASVKATVTADLRKVLEAPKPTAVVYRKRQSRRGGEDAFVELAAPPPASVVAIVLLDEAGTPKSFHWLEDRAAKSIAVYSSGGCVPQPDGTQATKPGDLVRVQFVDDAGRPSTPSKPIKVTAKP